MLVHVVEVLHRVVDEVVVVSSAELELPGIDARVVLDREPGLGPLAGIREGLLAIGAERAYVTSTDAPLITPQFVRALLAFEGAAAPVVDGIVQTLAAVYPRTLAQDAERLIAQGRMSAVGLLETAGFRRVRADELPDLDALRGLDTPQAYLEAVRQDDPGARAMLEFRGRAAELPIGTLGELLARGAPELAGHGWRASVAGCACVQDLRVPVGAERVIVSDAAGGPS
jgi:molybdopterin-guanine dinucleotide biosynthesis protein A